MRYPHKKLTINFSLSVWFALNDLARQLGKTPQAAVRDLVRVAVDEYRRHGLPQERAR